MRRSSAEIRRAIKFEQEEAGPLPPVYELEQYGEYLKHRVVVDVLRWAHGDPGTQYERLMKQRNKEDLARMPGKGKS